MGNKTIACLYHPVIGSGHSSRTPENALQEAVSLAEALPDLQIERAEIVRLRNVRPGLLFGQGKLDELSEQIAETEAELVIVDGPLTPIQQRNLERHWKTKVVDRTGLILEIFGERAQTREGVLQVELAALEYAKSRLVRSWTHLERQRGGLGFVGGAGETQIEADRRAINDAIQRLKVQLRKVTKTRQLHRSARKKVPFPIVALVGYTNAGKSTLFNRLSGASVLSQDMLFATLDPTMRALELPDGQKVILSDTVGFISDLPTQLVAAFRATLEEVLAADLILHVRDISHPESEEQAADVYSILGDLGITEEAQRKILEVWNKMDLVTGEDRQATEGRARRHTGRIAVSAVTGAGIEELLAAIADTFLEPVECATLKLAFGQARQRAWLFDRGLVAEEEIGEEGFLLHVRWSTAQKEDFAALSDDAVEGLVQSDPN